MENSKKIIFKNYGLITKPKTLIPQCYCAWCKKPIEFEVKAGNQGFCEKCANKISDDKRCHICFSKIMPDRNNHTGDTCCSCHTYGDNTGGNPRGHKEGGADSRNLKTNFWIENENDNIVKLYEGGR